MKYSLNIDMKELTNALSMIEKRVRQGGLEQAVLSGLFQLEGEAKINIEQTFKQHTGDFASKWETKIDQSSDKSAKGHTAPLAIQARIQELGGVIKATNAAALVFQTDDGTWHRVKAVTIPARSYLRKAADEHVNDISAAVGNVLHSLIEGK